MTDAAAAAASAAAAAPAGPPSTRTRNAFDCAKGGVHIISRAEIVFKGPNASAPSVNESLGVDPSTIDELSAVAVACAMP